LLHERILLPFDAADFRTVLPRRRERRAQKEAHVTVRIRVAAALVAVLATAMAATAQQAPMDEQKLRSEVNAFMDQYWELFSNGKIDQLVERIYHPSGQLNNSGHSSIEDMKRRFPDTRKTLLSAGYGRSQMPKRNVCVLSPTVAIVSGRGVRYLTDGRVMGEYGWTYTLLRSDAGWRMVSIYSHDPNKALICSN
jgi:hypothetical protein